MQEYTWEEFAQDSASLIEEIRLLVTVGKINSIYGIPRGGLVLASRLAYGLDLPIVERGEISPSTLIVDDIARTGFTLTEFYARHYYTVTLFWCPTSAVKPNFWVRKIFDYIRFPWALEDKPGRTEKKH